MLQRSDWCSAVSQTVKDEPFTYGYLEIAVVYREEGESIHGRVQVVLGPASETREPAVAEPFRQPNVADVIAIAVFALEAVDNELIGVFPHGAQLRATLFPRVAIF